jgi:serine/threonine protein kinase
MSAPTTTDDLVVLIRKSGLFDPERIDALVEQARLDGFAATPDALAAGLVRAGLLTTFHSEQFLLGKYRGFGIGKYRVLERLGFGGMGIVYLCEHQVMRHKVAIKVLPTSKAENPAALGRFYREARAAGILDHPNLVKAHDVDREGNLHFLVMDYVDGSSLHHIVSRTGPLDPIRAAHYIRNAAEGLEHARQAGLVHRDVKPANVVVERTGTARLLDLGLARFFADETDPLTMKYDEKNVLGTADYVAPEQAMNSHEVDTRADVYSLGCTFYFTLAGKPPFPDGKAAQKLIWHQVKEPTPIRALRPEVPEGMARVLTRMLAKDPDKRYQTPGEVAAALEPWTREALPPPPEEEMPRLSPAALRNAAGSGDCGPGSVPPSSNRRRHAPAPRSRSQGRRSSAVAQRSAARPAAGSAVPTPNVLASPVGADTHETAAPRSASILPAALSALMAPPLVKPSVPVQALRLAILVLAGILMTVCARWAASRVHRPLFRSETAPQVRICQLAPHTSLPLDTACLSLLCAREGLPHDLAKPDGVRQLVGAPLANAD